MDNLWCSQKCKSDCHRITRGKQQIKSKVIFAITNKRNEILFYCRQYNELLQLVQELYKLGFRVISHEANMVVGPGTDGFYHYLEVVFMREK